MKLPNITLTVINGEDAVKAYNYLLTLVPPLFRDPRHARATFEINPPRDLR